MLETGGPLAIGFEEARAQFGQLIEQGLVAELAGMRATPWLLEMCRYHLGTGGKRIRALIPLWICENRGGRVMDALELGVGLELLHNATLIHDDLQDGDETRRGRPALWTRYGEAQAINVGDALYFAGLETVARGPRGPELLVPTIAAMRRVIAGQVMEFQLQAPADDSAHMEATIANWERMARGKTGSLFGACFRAGYAAGRKTDGLLNLRAWHGEQLGLLFQIQDDYLDLVGDKGRERRGTDLAEGKLSYPVVWAYEHGDPDDVAKIREIVSTPREDTDDGMVGQGLLLLRKVGAIEATRKRVLALQRELGSAPSHDDTPGLVDAILRPIKHAL